MANSEYWAKRVAANEAKAQKFVGKELKRQQALFRKTYKEIARRVDDLELYILQNGGKGITRTMLWQYKKYQDLLTTIDLEMTGQAAKQVSLTSEALRKVFEEGLNTTLDMLPAIKNAANPAYTILNKEQTMQVLNTAWSGEHYSQRIYKTNYRIAERIKSNITDMVVMGRNSEDIKYGLMNSC